jgi:hypothetical protein
LLSLVGCVTTGVNERNRWPRFVPPQPGAIMPVEQPMRLQLVINMKTAKALGPTLAPAFLLRADEVIE